MSNEYLAYYYVTNVAKAKKFNLQSIAINKFITEVNKSNFIKDLSCGLEKFNKKYSSFLSRDIVFKNDSLVTRNSILISPAHYFYFTKLVIDIVLDSNENGYLSYRGDYIHAYYSGILFTSIDLIKKSRQILFNNSYNQFQKELLNNEGKQTIKIDLSKFFDSINTKDLIDILYAKYDKNKVQYLNDFFDYFGLSTLPQFHYSIASSILSQEYLAKFDNCITPLLKTKKFRLVRFVDDMYIFNDDNWLGEHEFHTILISIACHFPNYVG